MKFLDFLNLFMGKSTLLLLAIFCLLITGCKDNPTRAIFSAKYDQALYNPFHTSILGNAQGKVTLVEFFDYNCPDCRKVAPIIEQLVTTNPNLRVIFKPMNIFKLASSENAALAAMAANKQHKYLCMHNKLITYRQHVIPESYINTAANDCQLKLAALRKTMQSPALIQQLKVNHELADKLDIIGTPTFFIGDSRLAEYQSHKLKQYVVIGAANKDYLQSVISKVSRAENE